MTMCKHDLVSLKEGTWRCDECGQPMEGMSRGLDGQWHNRIDNPSDLWPVDKDHFYQWELDDDTDECESDSTPQTMFSPSHSYTMPMKHDPTIPNTEDESHHTRADEIGADLIDQWAKDTGDEK